MEILTSKNWDVLSDEKMSHGWLFALVKDEQMSNKVGVEHQPENGLSPWSCFLLVIFYAF